MCTAITPMLQAAWGVKRFSSPFWGHFSVDAGLYSQHLPGEEGGAAIGCTCSWGEALRDVASEDHTISGVAGRYATALLELALEEKALERIETDLNRFGEALDASEDLARLVKSPMFSSDDQGRALAAILDEVKIEGLTKNFLLLVARNRRLFAVPGMISAFRALAAAHRGEVSATVTTASQLNDTQATALKQALKAALGKDVTLDRVSIRALGGPRR